MSGHEVWVGELQRAKTWQEEFELVAHWLQEVDDHDDGPLMAAAIELRRRIQEVPE